MQLRRENDTVPVLVFVGCCLSAAAILLVKRYRQDPTSYATVSGTLHDRRALSIGTVVAAAFLALNIVNGDGITWSVFPAAFTGFVVAAIVHHTKAHKSR